jgi:excisionase family DNA binding protein
VSDPPLVRPSELARFWGLHPRTVHEWIRAGRLASVRTPGNQYRVRPADIRAFCERAKMAVPPFVLTPPKRVVLAGASAAIADAVRSALERRAILEHVGDPYVALVGAAIAPPRVLVLDARAARFAVGDALAAIVAAPIARPRIVVYDVASAAKCAALVAAGADAAIARTRRSELPAVIVELVRA